jgi:hypothetical protein
MTQSYAVKLARVLLFAAVTSLIVWVTPGEAEAHGSCSLSVDTFEGAQGFVKGQVMFDCIEMHYTMCAEVGLQFQVGSGEPWQNLDNSLNFNCNDVHNVRHVQVTTTGPLCNTQWAWRAYGFGNATNQGGGLAHRIPMPAGSWKFDGTPLNHSSC